MTRPAHCFQQVTKRPLIALWQVGIEPKSISRTWLYLVDSSTSGLRQNGVFLRLKPLARRGLELLPERT